MALLLLAACGGGASEVEAPLAPVRSELTGTVTPGYTEDTSQPGSPTQAGRIVVSVRGSRGIMRTSDSFGAGPADQHRTGLAELSPPYILSSPLVDGSFLVSVATGAGRANVTSLTTLLTAQLLGADPQTAFLGYGAEAVVPISRITDAQIAEAQAKVTAYLETALGVRVQSGEASFVTTEFSARAGDPMFDTIAALHGRLVADGRTLADISQSLAAEAKLCLNEKLVVSVGPQVNDFCPASKRGEPDDTDATVLNYSFSSSSGDELTLRLRGDAVLSATFTTAPGLGYTCAGLACTGISLGATAADLTRVVSFDATKLGEASLNGTLSLPAPGVAIPVLPCDNNKFALVLPDRSVAAACADADDPLGLGGVLGGAAGYPRVGFSLAGALQVYAQDGLVTSITYLVPYTDAASGDAVYFQCKGAQCAGATFGPPSINSDLGVDLTIRDLAIAGVQLLALRVDGTPVDSVAPAVLQGDFTTVEYLDPGEITPPPNDCAGTTERLLAQPDYRPEAIDICPLPGDKHTVQFDDGKLSISLIGSVPVGINPILSVSVVHGDASRVELQLSGQFSCEPCTGVTISPPDALGERKVSFAATVLRETGPAGLPGDHTLTLEGSFLAPPAAD